MKTSSTIALLAIVGGLLIFVAVYERNLPSTAEKVEREVRPHAFAPETADAIQITNNDSTLEVVREGGTWVVQEPYQDRANPEVVQTLLNGLLRLEWRETLARKDQDKSDYKRTGLGSSSATEVKVRGKGELLAHCRFGNKAPYEDSVYVSQPSVRIKDDKDLLHVAKTTLPALLAKPPEEWRDSKLLRLKAESVHRFVLAAGTGAIEFTRSSGQPWQLVKPLQIPASDDRVNAILAAMLNMEVRLNPTPESSPQTSTPALPPMKVTLEAAGLADPVVITMQPVESGQEVPVVASNREGSFLASAKLGDFWRLQPNHLRDQQLARIPVSEVTAVRLRSLALPEVVLDKTGESWVLSRFGKKEPGNAARIQALLDGLNAAQVREFVSDSATTNLELFGLEKPFLEIEWRIGAKARILQFGKAEQGVVNAKFKSEPGIVRINPLMLSIAPPETLKWRGGRVFSANLFSVRRIIIAEGVSPPLTLNYDPGDASWGGTIAGQDISPKIDRALANRLLNQLVNFDAAEWSTDRTAAIEALKNPSLTVQILAEDLENPGAPPVATTLTFAPTQPGKKTAIFYGRLNDEPDTFLVTREVYEGLVAPLLAK
jgi:hypothetical protein